MKMQPTKIVPPLLPRAVVRERLFRLFDDTKEYPVAWISSPAGAGKTTLVASYIKTRRIPTIWYRVDEADGDVGSFFYYMGEAAKGLRKGRGKPLPLFTPEYRIGMAAFTRHYFESLFSRISIPGLIVFDNYQDAPESSEFHDIIRNGLKLLPQGVRVFMVSRREPPPLFVSLKAESKLTGIDWTDIRFTLDEVREMVWQRKKTKVPEHVVQRIYDEAQGWAAAVVLMVDGKEIPSSAERSIGNSSIFHYFSVEVFRKLDEKLKDFLISAALLPSISPEIASRLTGMGACDAILADLSRNHYFTDRYGNEYRFHPLFKEFLLAQARKEYDRIKLASLFVEAAQLLSQAGNTEEAIRLLLDEHFYVEALPLMIGHARELVGLGRTATLDEWASRLPGAIRDMSPWLSYWLGIGHITIDPKDAGIHMEKAFRAFEQAGDQTGCLLSVAGIINSIIFEWDDYKPLDPWIDWVDRNVDPYSPLPSPDMEAHIASAMVCGLTWRRPGHPNMALWVQRAVEVSRKVDDILSRCIAKGHVIEHHAYMGNWAEMRPIAEELRRMEFTPDTPPLVHLAYMVRVLEMHDWVNGSWEETFQRLQKAISLAEKVGAYFHLSITHLHGVVAAFEMNNLEMAEDFLRKVEQAGFTGKKVARSFYYTLNSLYCLQKGDIATALHDGEGAVGASIESGVPIAEAYARVALAYALRRTGRPEEALAQLREADRLYENSGATHTPYLIRLTEASLLFDKGDKDGGRRLLKEAFGVGRAKGFAMNLCWYRQPDEMSRLCAEAFAADIEVEYAKELIKTNNLVPHKPLEKPWDWPWPFRVRTLGEFEIRVNGEPLTFAGKVQKKPLAFLKAIIALGGKGVREETIEDLLWIEAEGDAARFAFKTTLSRLRRLLKSDGIVELKDHKLTLHAGSLWLDTWEFERIAARISEILGGPSRGGKANEAWELSSVLMDLYQGEFLAGDDESWIDHYRLALHTKFLRTVKWIADALTQAGERDRALWLCEAALDRGISPDELRAYLTTPLIDKGGSGNGRKN